MPAVSVTASRLKPSHWQSSPSWELKRSCQRGLALPENIYCVSVAQGEVQCQAAAQANKPLFIRKRMLFVSEASLLESLLSIAADVLLTGHFIMLLTPWGMIPEKCIINCFRGQVPGSAVAYCHCYWLRPISRFFQEHTLDRRRLGTAWLLLLHTDWHSWKGTELARGRKSNQSNIQCPLGCIMKLKQQKEHFVHIPTCRAAGSLNILGWLWMLHVFHQLWWKFLYPNPFKLLKTTQRAPAWWKHIWFCNCTAADLRWH